MELGKLKHRIELYTVSTTADGEGGMTDPVYTLVSTKFAQVREMSEAEVLRSGLSMAERNVKITFHKNIGEQISRSVLIVWKDRRFNINSVNSDDYWFYIDAAEMDTYPVGGFDPGEGANQYHLTNVSQLTIINGDTLPPGVSPDILFIDTGQVNGDYTVNPLVIVKPAGYVFKKCYLDSGNDELINVIINDSEGFITSNGSFTGQRVIYQITENAVINGNFEITCGRSVGEEGTYWRAVLKFEKSML